MDVWLPRYGFPLFLHSDQGKEFDNVKAEAQLRQ